MEAMGIHETAQVAGNELQLPSDRFRPTLPQQHRQAPISCANQPHEEATALEARRACPPKRSLRPLHMSGVYCPSVSPSSGAALERRARRGLDPAHAVLGGPEQLLGRVGGGLRAVVVPQRVACILALLVILPAATG